MPEKTFFFSPLYLTYRGDFWSTFQSKHLIFIIIDQNSFFLRKKFIINVFLEQLGFFASMFRNEDRL